MQYVGIIRLSSMSRQSRYSIHHANVLVLLDIDHENQPGGARHTTSMVHMSADEHQEANRTFCEDASCPSRIHG